VDETVACGYFRCYEVISHVRFPGIRYH
jgi:hypothetical protein